MGLLDRLNEMADARAAGAPVVAPPAPPAPADPDAPPTAAQASLVARLFSRAGLPADYRARAGTKLGEAQRERGVSASRDLDRIKALPRRFWTQANPRYYSGPVARWFNTEGASCPGCSLCRWPDGSQRAVHLWEPQIAALHEMKTENGLLAPIGVGWGKTLILLLAHRAMEAKRTVLLVQPDLRDQLMKVDIPRYAVHYAIPPVAPGKDYAGEASGVWLVAYSDLSSAKNADILERIDPDLVVADEAHNLRHKSAARTKRFLRFMKAHPGCRFVALSGSMTTRSIKDYAHLAHLALRARSPLPLNWADLEEWAAALDPSDDPMPPGQLLTLEGAFGSYPDNYPPDPTTAARKMFRNRLVQTPGVVATWDGGATMGLVISERIPPPIPDLVEARLAHVRNTWTSPDGEEIYEQPTRVAAAARQLACGFWYRWDWGEGGKTPDDETWLEARRGWSKVVREILQYRSRPGLDSPMLVANAAERGELPADAMTAWETWEAVRHHWDPHPPTVDVWESYWLVDDALRWAAERMAAGEPGIIWYEHTALGEMIASVGKLALFGGGADSEAILATRAPVIVASIKAHGTGKNLQHYTHNLITSAPANGTKWEQLLGRTHRPGQLADTVHAEVYLHTPEALAAYHAAVTDATYVERTQGSRMKLLLAEKKGAAKIDHL